MSRFLDRHGEVLLEAQLISNGDVLETRILDWAHQTVILDVVHPVVGYHVVWNAVHKNAHGLFDQATNEDTIAVDQRADQRVLQIFGPIFGSKVSLDDWVDGRFTQNDKLCCSWTV
jgi:hypothetical protein